MRKLKLNTAHSRLSVNITANGEILVKIQETMKMQIVKIKQIY